MKKAIAYNHIPCGHSEFFLTLIHNGCEKIEKCFAVRFNNPKETDNFPLKEQEYFIVTLKEAIEREEYFGSRWKKMDGGVPYDFEALKDFIRNNDTIHRLEEEFHINVLGEESAESFE